MNNAEHVYVSVVIPMYNGGDSIRKCFEKLDNQTFPYGYEVIIVDDKSTDDSLAKVKKMILNADNPELFSVVECEKNGRAGKARNIGVKKATGDYILFVDQDDYPDERIIEVLYDLSDNGLYDYVSCAIFDKTGEIYYRPDLKIRKNFFSDDKRKLFGKYGYIFASLIRKRILDDNSIVFPEGVMFEDELFNESVISCIDSVITTKEILYYRFVDQNSQTEILTINKLSDRIDAAMEYVQYYSDNPKVKENWEYYKMAAFFYVYLSCMRWMLTIPDLYDEFLFDKCWKNGRKLDVDWKQLKLFEKRIKRRFLPVLKIVYYKPESFNVLRKIYYTFKPSRRKSL